MTPFYASPVTAAADSRPSTNSDRSRQHTVTLRRPNTINEEWTNGVTNNSFNLTPAGNRTVSTSDWNVTAPETGFNMTGRQENKDWDYYSPSVCPASTSSQRVYCDDQTLSEDKFDRRNYPLPPDAGQTSGNRQYNTEVVQRETSKLEALNQTCAIDLSRSGDYAIYQSFGGSQDYVPHCAAPATPVREDTYAHPDIGVGCTRRGNMYRPIARKSVTKQLWVNTDESYRGRLDLHCGRS